MNKIFALLILTIIILGCTSTPSKNISDAQKEKELVVYTYDSMVSEYGLGSLIVPKFEEKCNCKVKMIAKGDAGQIITALKLEKNNPKADIVLGIDNSLLSRVLKENLLEEFQPKNIDLVSEELRFDKSNHLTPYDYGFIAFIYDSEKVGKPESFEALLNPELGKKILIQNPRTSSPGMALLLWTIKIYGDPGYKDYWKKLKPNILTVTQGWDESAGLFSAGEAPIYLSYASSPPYYVEYEGIENYLAAEFKEGHIIQIEGMGILKSSKNKELAAQFIEFSLTEEFQNEIPFTQFMFPVNKNAFLPNAFDYAIIPKQLELDSKLIEEKEEEWILEWEKIMSG